MNILVVVVSSFSVSVELVQIILMLLIVILQLNMSLPILIIRSPKFVRCTWLLHRLNKWRENQEVSCFILFLGGGCNLTWFIFHLAWFVCHSTAIWCWMTVESSRTAIDLTLNHICIQHFSSTCGQTLLEHRYHTHTHSVLMAIFPAKPGLAGCLLNSSSPFIPGLCILLGQV